MQDEPLRELGTVDVLIVEDEPIILMIASDTLSDAGFTVRECGSAEDAFAAIADGCQPRLVIADHGLPGMNGTVMAQRMIADGQVAGAIITSGDPGHGDGLPILPKPYLGDDLIARVRSALND